MAEWLKATVLKTVVPQGTGGSNPSSSVPARRWPTGPLRKTRGLKSHLKKRSTDEPESAKPGGMVSISTQPKPRIPVSLARTGGNYPDLCGGGNRDPYQCGTPLPSAGPAY